MKVLQSSLSGATGAAVRWRKLPACDPSHKKLTVIVDHERV
jgi:hypothetical protein